MLQDEKKQEARRTDGTAPRSGRQKGKDPDQYPPGARVYTLVMWGAAVAAAQDGCHDGD